MIFVEVEEDKPAQGRGRDFWFKKAMEYHSLKEPVTLRQFAKDNNLKYTTMTSAFSRLKDDIKEALKKVPLTKEYWISRGVEFRASGLTARKYADQINQNYSTFTSSMSRYKQEIDLAAKAKELKKKSPRRQTKAQRALVMINDFRAGVKRRASVGNVRDKSQEWFNDFVADAVRGHKVSRPEAGKLYTFVYDAKHKDTLPYWDRFPLIIYLGDGTTKNGVKLMYGLNLHYVAPKVRQEFLEALLRRHASTRTFSNRTRLKVDWSSVRGMRGSDLMIKSYLPNHIRGTFVEIKPADWINVIFLATHQFMSKGKKFSARSVWAKY